MRRNCSFSTRTFHGGIAALALLGGVALSACGSDDEGSADTVAATVAPEDIKVDPSVVAAGLTKLPDTIASAIAAIGTADAEAKLSAIEDEWFSFEGTVRATDPDIYLAIEDNLDPVRDQIKAGDSAAATTTLATLKDLFTQYLNRYPG